MFGENRTEVERPLHSPCLFVSSDVSTFIGSPMILLHRAPLKILSPVVMSVAILVVDDRGIILPIQEMKPNKPMNIHVNALPV